MTNEATPVSDEVLVEIEVALEKATPGPWVHPYGNVIKGDDQWVARFDMMRRDDVTAGFKEGGANAALTVLAVNNAPAIIARLRQAEADRDAAIREMSGWARKAGEWQGRYEGSEAAGAVEGWRERADAAEKRIEALEAGLRPFADVADVIDEVGRAHEDDDRVNIVQAYGVLLSEMTEADFRRAHALLNNGEHHDR